MRKLGTACRSGHKIENDMRMEEKARGQGRGEEGGGRGEGRKRKVSMWR